MILAGVFDSLLAAKNRVIPNQPWEDDRLRRWWGSSIIPPKAHHLYVKVLQLFVEKLIEDNPK